jgi:hypothetical protein
LVSCTFVSDGSQTGLSPLFGSQNTVLFTSTIVQVQAIDLRNGKYLFSGKIGVREYADYDVKQLKAATQKGKPLPPPLGLTALTKSPVIR